MNSGNSLLPLFPAHWHRISCFCRVKGSSGSEGIPRGLHGHRIKCPPEGIVHMVLWQPGKNKHVRFCRTKYECIRGAGLGWAPHRSWAGGCCPRSAYHTTRSPGPKVCQRSHKPDGCELSWERGGDREPLSECITDEEWLLRDFHRPDRYNHR